MTHLANRPLSLAGGALLDRARLSMRSVPRWRWRRGLQLALGALWLLDAALQYQPYMFTRAFPREIVAPTAAGNPAWVAAPVRFAAALLAGHVVLFNALFATVQLAIGLGLFRRATVKLALAASVLWSVLVWWLGEGLGGVLTGAVSPLAGFPGAVVLYGLAGVLLWPRAGARAGRSLAERSVLGPVGAGLAWVLLWWSSAVEALLPADRAPGALPSLIRSMADGEPPWLSSLDRHVAGLLAGHGLAGSVVLAALCAFVGLGAVVRRLARAAAICAMVLAATIWVVGENLGGLATGTATDPNSGLPLLLLAACYLPIARVERAAGGGAGRRG